MTRAEAEEIVDGYERHEEKTVGLSCSCFQCAPCGKCEGSYDLSLVEEARKILANIKERPILFNGEMVRAILEGRKTQTRRIVKTDMPEGPFDCHWNNTGFAPATVNEYGAKGCTCAKLKPFYGFPGDRLWVRETFSLTSILEISSYEIKYADGETKLIDWIEKDLIKFCDRKKHPSIHMPRCASRILLEIVCVRVEHLNQISNEGAMKEGVKPSTNAIIEDFRGPFIRLWNEINGVSSFQRNPWVWVIEFKRIEP